LLTTYFLGAGFLVLIGVVFTVFFGLDLAVDFLDYYF
jgi:hypothetical protein